MLETMVNKIICGDCLTLLKQLPADSIDLVITSPPYYQQREYGGGGIGNENTVAEYIQNLAVIFRECVRVTKPTGNIVFNIGDKYEDSSLCLVPYKFAIYILEHEKVRLVNNITWVKQNPTPRQYRKRLVSSTEPFFHFVKSEDYYYNLDDFFANENKQLKNGNSGHRLGNGYFDMIRSSDLSPQEKANAEAELYKVIQEVKEGKIQSFRMKIRGLHSLPFGGQEGGRKTQILKKGFTIIRIFGNPIKRDVIETPVETIKGIKHPAIYPESIITEMIKLLTKKGSIVLDPFMGSGTTAVAAKKTGRQYIGFEINPTYCKSAEERIRRCQYQSTLTDI